MVKIALGPAKMAAEAKETVAVGVITTSFKGKETEVHAIRLDIIPHLNSSFFCLSLRTGTKIIGCLYAVISFMLLVGGLMLYVAVIDGNTRGEMKWTTHGTTIVLLPILIMALPTAVFAITLLVGVFERKAELLRPFMVVLNIHLGCDVFLRLMGNAICDYDSWFCNPVEASYYYLLCVFRFFFDLYSLVVVSSYQKKLQRSKPQVYIIVPQVL